MKSPSKKMYSVFQQFKIEKGTTGLTNGIPAITCRTRFWNNCFNTLVLLGTYICLLLNFQKKRFYNCTHYGSPLRTSNADICLESRSWHLYFPVNIIKNYNVLRVIYLFKLFIWLNIGNLKIVYDRINRNGWPDLRNVPFISLRV